MHFHLETPQFLGETSALTWAVKEEPGVWWFWKMACQIWAWYLNLDKKISTILPSPSCCYCLHLPWCKKKKKKNPPHVYFNKCLCSMCAAWRNITNLHFIIQTCVYIITHKSPCLCPELLRQQYAARLLLSTSPSALCPVVFVVEGLSESVAPEVTRWSTVASKNVHTLGIIMQITAQYSLIASSMLLRIGIAHSASWLQDKLWVA